MLRLSLQIELILLVATEFRNEGFRGNAHKSDTHKRTNHAGHWKDIDALLLALERTSSGKAEEQQFDDAMEMTSSASRQQPSLNVLECAVLRLHALGGVANVQLQVCVCVLCPCFFVHRFVNVCAAAGACCVPAHFFRASIVGT